MDQCTHCVFRGDFDACQAEQCTHHETWYAKQLQARLAAAKAPLRDIDAEEVAGVQIGTTGHRLWVCVDGQAVLRVKSPAIELQDMRPGKGHEDEDHN